MINIINENKTKQQNLRVKRLKKKKVNELLSDLFLTVSAVICFTGIVFLAIVVNGVMFA